MKMAMRKRLWDSPISTTIAQGVQENECEDDDDEQDGPDGEPTGHRNEHDAHRQRHDGVDAAVMFAEQDEEHEIGDDDHGEATEHPAGDGIAAEHQVTYGLRDLIEACDHVATRYPESSPTVKG